MYKRVRFVIPEEDVEDITQEIFIAVMKSLKSFRYEARFSTWLRTLVNRQVADYYRRRHPDESSLDELTEPEADLIPFLSIMDHTSKSTIALSCARRCASFLIIIVK